MNDQDRATLAVVAAGLIVAVGVGIHAAMPTVRVERRKRAQIKAWEQENRACVKNAQTRLVTMLEDPKYNFADFWKAWDEENKFLDIMQNRPMY